MSFRPSEAVDMAMQQPAPTGANLRTGTMEWLTSPEAWIALATLTMLEIVLGVDNIIFISILVGRLPPASGSKARVIGLGLAMLSRIALLMSLAWMMRLTAPLFVVTGLEITGRTLILVGGGLFLLAKSVMEIHGALEGARGARERRPRHAGFAGTLVQIAIIDIVFSLDSVITAVGMANDVAVMVLAIVIAVAVMMFAAKPISDFVDAAPDDQDAGALVPDPDRRRAGRRGPRRCTFRRATSTSRWPSRSSSRCSTCGCASSGRRSSCARS